MRTNLFAHSRDRYMIVLHHDNDIVVISDYSTTYETTLSELHAMLSERASQQVENDIDDYPQDEVHDGI